MNMMELKEIGIGLLKFLLGMVILVEGVIVLIFVDYITTVGGRYDDNVSASDNAGYNADYAEYYDTGYNENYDLAYENGYDTGYTVGSRAGAGSLNHSVGLRLLNRAELREFLSDDNTDSAKYVSREYSCSDFAANLNNNAEASGIRAAYVRIRSTEWGHAIVCFDTVDKGLIFIEPQSDKEVELSVGEPYPWYLVGAVSPMGYFDPVSEIQIIW